MGEEIMYRRAKSWQLALAVMSQVVPTALVILMTFASYVAVGVYGATSVLAGTIITGTRVFDAITDPVCGFLTTRLKSKFGRVRPLLVCGWLIVALAIALMFIICPGKGNVFVFVLIYILYIIGYTVFNTGDGMVASIITNDPKQRPMVGRWAAVFKSIFSGTFSMILAATLMPKHGYQYGLPLFKDLALLMIGITGLFTALAVIAITASKNDVPETYKDKNEKPIKFVEMFKMIGKSRPLQMFTIAAASDALALQTASQSAINVMIFGICIGNYRFSGSISLYMTAVTVAMLFLTSGIAKKNGTKKTLVQWTAFSMIAYAAMYIFMMTVDTLAITKVAVLTVAFIVLRCLMNATQMIVSSCTFPMIADITDYELSQSGHFSPSIVAMTYSFVQKLISSLGATIVGLAVASIGYVNSMPQATDPFSRPVLNIALFLWLGMPMLGYVCTLIAMKFYKLDKKKMEEVAMINAGLRK
ncbi:MAG: MFS transporter [Sphaerochaetaceae bacterium]|nr:MFS transporter [Sphaerochaetaceae bacterium]